MNDVYHLERDAYLICRSCLARRSPEEAMNLATGITSGRCMFCRHMGEKLFSWKAQNEDLVNQI